MLSTSQPAPESRAVTAAHTTSSAWSERLLPTLLSMLLGAVLLFGAGFSSKIELHNAAHDGRHSAGFPCH